ncbi:hypothetical protein OC842_003448 [Tilletia horrida]|uniref:RxLR effector protein n=1 Tax=Tilletia horrida TaxID=155126 RepID=A0AAN6JL70_9BASI|nr:hypothetical protein OC842_003448 [Tilletia horrida]
MMVRSLLVLVSVSALLSVATAAPVQLNDLDPSPARRFVARSTQADNPDANSELFQSKKSVLQHATAALDIVKEVKASGSTSSETLDKLAVHMKAISDARTPTGSQSSSSSSSPYTGKITELPKDAAPHRDGKPSSADGPASSSGRRHR